MRSTQAAVVGGCRRQAVKQQNTVLSLSAPGATIRLPTGSSSLFYAARQSRGVVNKRHDECATTGEAVAAAARPDEHDECLHNVDLETGEEDAKVGSVHQQTKRVTSQCFGPGVASLTCNSGPKRVLCNLIASRWTCGTLQCAACVIVGFCLGVSWRESANHFARMRNESTF